MRVGLIGSGNMARALARGWGEPVLCTDAGSGRAAALAAEVGGRATASNRELAEEADLVVLCHKPAQLRAVAGELAGTDAPVVSLLARVRREEVEAAYPGRPVLRLVPNVAVEVRQGVTVLAADTRWSAEQRRVRALFERVGVVVELPEGLIDAANGISGVGPAYWALLVEAQVDAGVRHGIPAPQAAVLVTETMAGSAALLRHGRHDTHAVRRAVTSPAGVTARGLAALERGGVRAAFHDALDAVLSRA